MLTNEDEYSFSSDKRPSRNYNEFDKRRRLSAVSTDSFVRKPPRENKDKQRENNTENTDLWSILSKFIKLN